MDPSAWPLPEGAHRRSLPAVSVPNRHGGRCRSWPGRRSCSFALLVPGAGETHLDRSQQVTDACKKHGGFYLGSIGGPAAILAKTSIKSVEVVDFPELGMEAVRKIRIENFPAFIIVDDKGNDFYKML